VTVEYSLTPLGASLLEAVQGIRTWAYAHIDEIEAARGGYDRQTAAAAT
jgi:DNA-binding HxlR family transcriptional regulator